MELPVAEPRKAPELTLVVPCYNEAEGLQASATQLLDVLKVLRALGRIGEKSRLCMIDDGSTDETWDVIQSLVQGSPDCAGIKLTRNFGHQNALLAGLLSSPGDALVSLDADLQDDPNVIGDMVDEYLRGADVVFGVREDRSVDNVAKRGTARGYYKLLKGLGVNIVEDHADFRLMSRRAIESLRQYPEVNLFLRALVPQLGYRQSTVSYARQERTAGETKYTLRKMLSLAANGVTSFSAAPLRIIALIGLLVFIGSFAMSIWALSVRLFTDAAVPGWASSVLPMYFLGGVQLLSIAVVGEYVSKIYLESKARPRFLLQETLGLDE